MLVSNGADVKAKTDHGLSVLNVTRNVDVLEFLKAYILLNTPAPIVNTPAPIAKARQDNLGLDRDDVNPMALPPGAIRDSMKARQANLHLDRDDVDPMALPPGEARQNNL